MFSGLAESPAPTGHLPHIHTYTHTHARAHCIINACRISKDAYRQAPQVCCCRRRLAGLTESIPEFPSDVLALCDFFLLEYDDLHEIWIVYIIGFSKKNLQSYYYPVYLYTYCFIVFIGEVDSKWPDLHASLVICLFNISPFTVLYHRLINTFVFNLRV